MGLDPSTSRIRLGVYPEPVEWVQDDNCATLALLGFYRREAECLSVGVVGFEAIGSGSPGDFHSLRLALRAQPLRLGNVHASVAAALVLRGCLLRCTYLTASTKTFSPSASDSCKPAVESFHTITFACVWREAPYRKGSGTSLPET